jgi:hypothetical protein
MTEQLRLGEPEGRPLILEQIRFKGTSFRDDLDGARLRQQQAMVLWLMLDERWHTIFELRSIGGASGDRRARQLRDVEAGGFEVECKRARQIHPSERPAHLEDDEKAKGAWLYRIVPGSVTPEKIQRFIAANKKVTK